MRSTFFYTIIITIFSKPTCSYCKKAKALLTEKGMSFEELEVGKDVNLTMFKALTNAETVPQIFIDGKHIGGSEALEAFFN